MDLMTLDANNQPSKLIENYDSLIWTERFNTVGDFQITTGNIEDKPGKPGFLTLLPEGTRLTLRETNQVAVVETHKIERKKNTAQKLTITGRMCESYLDRRVAIQSVLALTGTADWKVNVKTPSDLAYYIINKICVEGLVSAADIFPSSMLQFPAPADYLASSGPVKEFVVPRGNLLTVVAELLQQEAQADATTDPDTPAVVPHGIRAVRPNSAGTAIGIQIYTGTDKSGTIYWDARRELLDDGTYLFSKVGSANAAYGVGNGIAATMYEGVSEPTGLDRRVTLVDASQAEIEEAETLRIHMAQSLSEASETSIFDGSINQDLNPYVYGADYNLGDIVKVVGDYGLVENARVTEYIRTEDATGQKAYPTLSTIVS